MGVALKSIIGISTVIVLLTAAYVGYLLMVSYASGVFDKAYTRQELVARYSEHRAAIHAAISYYEAMVPNDKEVEIEFEHGDITRMVVKAGTAKHPTYTQAWDSKKEQVDSLVASLGWSDEVVQQLQEKLDAANCISIQNGEPAVLGFKRSGMGVYSFNVFNHPMADSLRDQYTRSCTHLIQSQELVLEYGGGAFGPQCFPAGY